MTATAPRWALFAVVLAVIALDLGSKQWAMTHLAGGAHPMVVTPADGATVAAAFAKRGVQAAELRDAIASGSLWRYQNSSGLQADAPLKVTDSDLDLVATDGTGLPAPRRLRVQPNDAGQTLATIVSSHWRVQPGEVQGLLDKHTIRAADHVTDVNAPLDGPVVLRERNIPIIDRFCSLVYAENFGAAWSFLSTAPPMLRHLLFVTISLIASLMMGWALWHGRMGTNWASFALAGIMGGAIGNLVDRVRFHAVVDFIYNFVFVGGQVHSWPVYNVADIGISAGVIAIALEMLVRRQPAAAAVVPDRQEKA